MSSGEWDLRALKALEEEEQREFLALSQKSLFEPPSPPTVALLPSQHAPPHHQQQQQQQSTYGGGGFGGSLSGLSYAQLQPHLLKLPTINECQLMARQRQLLQQQRAASVVSAAGSGGGGSRLKFTRALSLSAHSLSGRIGLKKSGHKSGKLMNAGGGSVAGGGTKSSGSLSPPQYSASPVYTPPPIRRCATLHHTQPVRKTFKTLQQLEKQKQERKQAAAAAAATAAATVSHVAAATLPRKSPQLHRVAGTNKTYWKYGANSTAASIIGQRTQQQQQQLQQQQQPKTKAQKTLGKKTPAAAAAPPPPLPLVDAAVAPLIDFGDDVDLLDDDDGDGGGCDVPPPLRHDNVDMMRLLLNATPPATATTNAALGYVSCSGSESAYAAYYASSEPPLAATLARCAASVKISPALKATNNNTSTNNNNNTTTQQSTAAAANIDVEHVVAYEAFHALARRKSFSGRQALQRGHSLAEAEERRQHAVGVAVGVNSGIGSKAGGCAAAAATTASAAAGKRKMLKSTSVDGNHTMSVAGAGGGGVCIMDYIGGNGATGTIITNPIVEANKVNHICANNNNNNSSSSNHNQNNANNNNNCNTNTSSLSSNSTKTKNAGGTAGTGGGSGGSSGGPTVHFNEAATPSPPLPPQQHHPHAHHTHAHQQQQQPAMLCQEFHRQHGSPQQQQQQHLHQHAQHQHHHQHHHQAMGPSSQQQQQQQQQHLIDDELEQHIKHCSCSCNHMGYGNSMDYQTTGFGGLPDVTEHSNIRRTTTTLSRQNSMSNSDSGGEIASIQKTKVNFGDISKTLASAGAAVVTGAGGVGGGVGGVGIGGIGGMGMGIGGVVGIGGVGMGGGVDGVIAASITNSSASAKRKSKAAQQHSSHGGTHNGVRGGGGVDGRVRYKATRRGTLLLSLTLVAALCLLAIAATLAYQHFLMAPSRNSHAQRLRIVRRILRDVPLVDGHNNFAWNVRKYAHSSLELVHLSHDIDQKAAMWTRPTWAQTDMERLRQGLVGVQVWSAYVPCDAQGLDAVQLALEQIDIIRRLSDLYAAQTTLVTTSKEIETVHRRGQLASLIGIEGGHTIGSSLGVLRSFYSLGARYLSLTHRCDVSWAGSSATQLESGLSQFGKAIVREMNRLGMMIDLSYSSDATARDVLQVTRAPVIFSHSGARQLCNSTRNIPDDILRLVAENGGLIMISFDSEDVTCGRQAHLTDVIEHIKYVRAIAGIQHIGLGAGYDGIDVPPIGLEDVSKYPDLLATLLEDHNWSEEDVGMLAGKNFLRIMATVETVRDYWKRAAIQPIEQTEPQPKTQCTYMSS